MCDTLITYSCANTGPNTDMCAEGYFDTSTGNYDIQTLDISTYPPGDYIFTITGYLGNKSAIATFTVTFINPCDTATLSITKPPEFVD